jgi:predicted small metal-binding protein
VVKPNVCLRETSLDCDFVVRGNNRKEFLKNGADHFINQHGMDAKEIYWDEIPVILRKEK